jgi:hypothetical protein
MFRAKTDDSSNTPYTLLVNDEDNDFDLETKKESEEIKNQDESLDVFSNDSDSYDQALSTGTKFIFSPESAMNLEFLDKIENDILPEMLIKKESRNNLICIGVIGFIVITAFMSLGAYAVRFIPGASERWKSKGDCPEVNFDDADCNDTTNSSANLNCSEDAIVRWCDSWEIDPSAPATVASNILFGVAGLGGLIMFAIIYFISIRRVKDFEDSDVLLANQIMGVDITNMDVKEITKAIQKTKNDIFKKNKRSHNEGIRFFKTVEEMKIEPFQIPALQHLVFEYLDCPQISQELNLRVAR